jgi:hypothetical protein
MEEDMSATLAQAFSLEEFTAATKHLSKDKAPGPSMVNSNMIKAWDAGIVQEPRIVNYNRGLRLVLVEQTSKTKRKEEKVISYLI